MYIPPEQERYQEVVNEARKVGNHLFFNYWQNLFFSKRTAMDTYLDEQLPLRPPRFLRPDARRDRGRSRKNERMYSSSKRCIRHSYRYVDCRMSTALLRAALKGFLRRPFYCSLHLSFNVLSSSIIHGMMVAFTDCNRLRVNRRFLVDQ